jgi:2-keto-3-deoxy-L-rhamnonate aldolase RhmA
MVQDRTEAGGAAMGKDSRLDFIFYDMERNYDLATLKTFMAGLRASGSQALLARIAPVADGRDAAAKRVAELLEAGVDGIVFPHTHNQSDAEFGAGLLKSHRRGLWPLSPNGTLVGYFMIEDRDGVENAKAIISTPGVSIASPGQGSLRSAYGGDAQAAENAMQTVAGTCRSLKAVCAKLVNESDVEKRLQEGYRLIIASGAALDLGRKLAGR